MFGSSTAIRELQATIAGLIDRSIRTQSVNADIIAKAILESCAVIAKSIQESTESRDAKLEQLTVAINNVATLLKRLSKPPKPGLLRIVVSQELYAGEDRMVDILEFKVMLPTPPAEPNDIVNGQLMVQIGDAEPVVVVTAKDQAEVVGLSAEQDSTVTLSYVYVDDSGNISEEPSTLVAVLEDTIAPPAPGTLGVVVTGETTVEDAPVEPPAEEEPPVEEEQPVEPPAEEEPPVEELPVEEEPIG